MPNNKSLILIFFMSFFSILSKAQNGKDSIYLFHQDSRRIENKLLFPMTIAGDKLESYGLIQLDFKHDQGGFRRAQEAYTVKSPKFTAAGFNKLGKFKLAGSFVFDKSFEDSLANGQKNNLEDLSTYYAYANKSGNYERQNYIMKTSLSYDVINNQFVPFVNLDYHKHWSTGSIDPRLNSNRFIFKVKPGIGTSFGKHSVSAYGLFGKADEQLSLMYKNASVKNNTMNPDRIHYMNYGYGGSRTKDTSSVFRYDNYKGVGINYLSNIKGWETQLSIEYQLLVNKNYDRSRSSLKFNPIGIFNLNTISGSLLLSDHRSAEKNQQITADFIYNEGYDGNLKTSGSLNKVNYRVNALNLNASYHYLWDKNARTSKELGFAAFYAKSEKKDLAQAVSLAYQQLQLRVNSNLYHKIDNQSWYKLSFSPYYILPIKTELIYNKNSLTEFIRNVVYTDYFYYNSRALGTELRAEYASSKLIKNQNLGLYAQVNTRSQLNKQGRADLNPTFIPNGYRTVFNVGVNLYL